MDVGGEDTMTLRFHEVNSECMANESLNDKINGMTFSTNSLRGWERGEEERSNRIAANVQGG